jgi:hypothetical protein
MSMNRWIGAAVFTLVAFGAGAGTIAQETRGVMPTIVGDLTTAQLIEVRDKGGQVLLHGTLTTEEDTPKETERKADLKSPNGQAAKGEVEIEIERKDGTVTKHEIEVEVEKLPAMLPCDVFLDGRSIGSFVTSKKGKAELKLK